MIRIRVVRLGYLPVESMIDLDDGAQGDIRLTMQRNSMLDSILVVAESNAPPMLPVQQLIIGRLIEEETGEAMPDGTIELRDAKNKTVATAITDRRGRFRILTPTPGTYSMTGKRIGYLAAQQGNLRMQPGDTVIVDFRLSKTAVLLGPVTVTASAKPWTDRIRSPLRDALYSRMERFKGRHQAQFIFRDTIDALNRRNFSTAEAINRIVLMKEPKNGGCSGVKHYIDGNHYIVPFDQRFADQLLMLSGLELIEVFTHPAIPAEFASPNLAVSPRSSTVPPCRVISVWSRPG